MIRTMLLAVFALGPTASAGTGTPSASQSPRNLRCECLVDPLGIDRISPQLSWEPVDSRRGVVQIAYRILAASDVDKLKRDEGDLWDSGRVESGETAHVPYAGKPLAARMPVWWKVRVWTAALDEAGQRRDDEQPSAWSEPATWSMGLLKPDDWSAKWIGDSTKYDEAAPVAASQATSKPVPGPPPLPAQLLRKAFSSPTPTKRATAYVTALGCYELHINGQRVGDHILAPEWTNYHKAVQYQSYDVTSLIRPGENVIGAILGDGWYAGRIGLAHIVPNGPIRAIYGRRPRLLVQLEIEAADGKVVTVASDSTWRQTNDGPIRVSDILDGESYDATLEMAGWDQAGFDDSRWSAAGVFGDAVGHGGPTLRAQPNEPIRIGREIKPIAVSEPKPGVFVFDMGQNMVGWCRAKLRGSPGSTITLRHAEVLNPDGTIYTANLRAAAQTDRYTLVGAGSHRLETGATETGATETGATETGATDSVEATFEPHFTYHGFRYVELTGVREKPPLDALTGCVFNSACREVGRFECSNPRINKLMQNILWTQRGNLMSVPTDCPQRDERCGWMGDILAFAQTACFNMDMEAFFNKWLADVREAQADDGRFPDFAPHPYDPNVRFSGVPAWGDAGVFVPWTAYVNYGDKRLLEENYDAMKRWVDWIDRNNPNLIWTKSRNNDYGDWLNADTLKLAGWPVEGAEMPKDAFGSAFFARSTELVSQSARVLNRPTDAQKYGDLAERIRAGFMFTNGPSPEGTMRGDTQASYAIALHFDLLFPALRETAAKHMVDAFKRYNGQISTEVSEKLAFSTG